MEKDKNKSNQQHKHSKRNSADNNVNQNNHESHQQTKQNHDHDHTDHHRMMIKDFKLRFWISLIFTLPILALSPMVQNLLGFEFALLGAADKYLLFGLSSIVFFYGGWPFLK